MKVIRMCFVWAAAFLFFGGSFSFPAKAQTRANHKPPLSKPPATLEGNWAGSLEAGDAVLHLVLHVSKAEDGSFKAVEELKALYDGAGVDPKKDTIAYCRIGERSSHTWYVLKYLLGYPNVRNYDGSWTEWGNLVGAPIERTAPVKQA